MIPAKVPASKDDHTVPTIRQHNHIQWRWCRIHLPHVLLHEMCPVQCMLLVEPTTRCTLTDLLKGGARPMGSSAALQSNGINTPSSGHFEDHDYVLEDKDDSDEWVKGIVLLGRCALSTTALDFAFTQHTILTIYYHTLTLDDW